MGSGGDYGLDIYLLLTLNKIQSTSVANISIVQCIILFEPIQVETSSYVNLVQNQLIEENYIPNIQLKYKGEEIKKRYEAEACKEGNILFFVEIKQLISRDSIP